MRLVIAAAIFGAALAPAVAGANTVVATPKTNWNPAAPENRQLLPAFTPANIEATLTTIGARHQRSGAANRPMILVTFTNGRKATLALGACDAAGTSCKSLSIQSHWTRIASAPPERVRLAIDGFNQRYAFAKAFVATDGRPSLQRYLTADYGFMRGNLAVNLLVFADQADQFARTVLAPLESGAR